MDRQPALGIRRAVLPCARATLRGLLAVLVILAVFPRPGCAGTKAGSEGAWPEITAEERALTKVPQDPDADAVVIANERSGKIIRKADDWVNVLDYHWRLKVLTERGKRYGEVHIGAQKYSRASNIQARTIKPDGTIVPVAPDQIFEKVTLQVGDFKLTEWVFNFPAVEPGAILEYRYERHDNFLLYIDPWFFEGPEFTLRSKVTQVVPLPTAYSVLCDLCPNVQPTLTAWHEGKDKGQLYSLELRDLPGYKDEILMPPRRETSPRMEMVLQTWKNIYWEELGRQDRLFTDWNAVARYAAAHYDKTVKDGQAAIKPVVEGWVKGIGEPQEKVKAIVRHVQADFRYVPFTQVIGRSPSIDSLLKEKIADNESKAVLLMAALTAIGLEPRAALVAGRDLGSLNPKFYSLSQFTHVVAGLPRPDGTVQWLDPTVSEAPFGFMPWKDSGAGALVLKGREGEILDLPVRKEISTTRYAVTVKPRSDGKAAIELVAQYTGEDAIEMRDDLVPQSESGRTGYLQEWVKDRRPGAALTAHSFEDLENFDKPLQIKMTLEAPGLVTVAEGVLAVRGCVFTCRDSNPISRGTRAQPFYVDRGWNVDETVVVQPPDGMAANSMPPPAAARSSIATLTFSCVPQGEGGARCSQQFVARSNRWPASEQVAVRGMYDKIVEANRSTVAFTPKVPGGA